MSEQAQVGDGSRLHLGAVLALAATVGENAVLDAHSTVGALASVGARVRIGDLATVAPSGQIGSGAVFEAMAETGRNCRVGDKTVLEKHAVLMDDAGVGERSSPRRPMWRQAAAGSTAVPVGIAAMRDRSAGRAGGHRPGAVGDLGATLTRVPPAIVETGAKATPSSIVARSPMVVPLLVSTPHPTSQLGPRRVPLCIDVSLSTLTRLPMVTSVSTVTRSCSAAWEPTVPRAPTNVRSPMVNLCPIRTLSSTFASLPILPILPCLSTCESAPRNATRATLNHRAASDLGTLAHPDERLKDGTSAQADLLAETAVTVDPGTSVDAGTPPDVHILPDAPFRADARVRRDPLGIRHDALGGSAYT